jgi:polysaccharide pyruvyl transferase WcaK-like protein
VRILVDHSGYALLNVGDVAMLQACVRRLKDKWPDADIQVITESPERLEQYCPGATAVAQTVVGRRGASALSMSAQLALEQMWKTAIPLLVRSRSRLADDDVCSAQPRLPEAIRTADIVVSSGGGFVNDVFWWHGAGVLSVLALAQRLGKPTAMFGQGIGPLHHPVLSQLVKRIMPRLNVIGLREGVVSGPLLKSHRVDHDRISVTGDDALYLATAATRPPTGTSIGVNVRVAAYSGVDASVADRLVSVASEAARRHRSTVSALPVSRYEAHSDLQILRTGIGAELPDREFDDIRTPEELAERAAQCRVVVTGSYHAAVFGLASGVPAVCITNSRYYDGKFEGLAAQFPGGCYLLRPGRNFERELSTLIDVAWERTEAGRDELHSLALAQVAKADMLYERFKALAAARPKPCNGANERRGAREGPPLPTENRPIFEESL